MIRPPPRSTLERSSAASDVYKSQPQGSEAFLWIDGMHCASCEFLIEKLALKHPGVLAAASNYATATARIVYDLSLIHISEPTRPY